MGVGRIDARRERPRFRDFAGKDEPTLVLRLPARGFKVGGCPIPRQGLAASLGALGLN